MRIETKDGRVSCPGQNWQKIATTNCTQTGQRCQYFVRWEDIQIICNRPPNKEPEPTIQDGIRIIPAKDSPPMVLCPKGDVGYKAPIQKCFKCWNMISVTWTQVKCAFPKKGADFGGSRPSAS